MITSHASPAKETPGEPTTATRHLCAGVYVDERFRDLVVDEVCTAPHRRVAPSYGFDIVPVMHHAWRAAALSALLRVTVVGAVVGPALAGAAPAATVVTCGVALLWLAHLARLLCGTDPDRRFERRTRRRVPGQQRGQRGRRQRGWRGLLALIFTESDPERRRKLKRIGWAALAVASTALVVAALHPADGAVGLLLLGVIVVVCLLVGALRQVMLNRILRAGSLRPRKLSRRQRAADAQQQHVCVVYRRPRHTEDEDDEDDLTMFTLFGDQSPFVGAGELVYQWNPPMSIQLLRPGDDEAPLHEREHPAPPFQAHELVDHLREAVGQLASDNLDVRLPAQARDRVYVAETDVAAHRALLPRWIGERDMREIIDTPGARQHHFLEVTTPTGGGEFVATVLLHVNVQGRTLSISTAACVLAHTPRSFQRITEFGQHGAPAVVWAAFRELATLPTEIPRLWRIIRYVYTLGKAALLPRDLTRTRIRNVLIGTRVSIREEMSQAWPKIQLEKSYILGQMKTIEWRLLRAASDFLRSRDVEISEFNDRALKIINSGIVNIGDNNTFTNNAVGSGAQAGSPAGAPSGANAQSSGGDS
ncbi:hypothetical protein [Streptomyces smyrnaeus]|uniref:hypothetical protein n=1 Tax=Streptomyces smyrnaeus TaxID=1387713 RepID=UPI001FD8615E|nr:hypothetical protein [Streptomyces smyrnaeus]